VYPLIKIIVAAGKIPILIGGGHNNCYPIIKGVSLALDTPINTLNIDAHADLRATDEGRHSGNGFSTAIRDKYLSEYRIFGLHKSYLSEAQHSFINQHKSIQVRYFDDLIASKSKLSQALEELIAEVEKPLGLEIDLDSICGALASAASPSGFTLNELRQIILNTKREFAYLHICEGAYQLNDGRSDNNIGKTIAYLISDFIRATNNI
jgi:formiminoglutamase